MKNNSKRGFTIVELIIVIAVIAILAATLIPTFGSLIRRANVAADESLVSGLNKALAMDTTTEKHTTMQSALEAAADGGYILTRIKSTVNGNKVLWDSANDCFVYLDAEKGNEPQYIPDSKKTDVAGAWDYWEIVEQPQSTNAYSQYLNNDFLNTTVVVSAGFDAGNNSNPVEVKYENKSGTAKEVTIRTNGGNLTVDGTSDTVHHYGMSNQVTVTSVDTTHSYHEYGKVVFLTAVSGHIVVENGGLINKVASADPNVTFDRKSGGMVLGTDESGNAQLTQVVSDSATDKASFKYEIATAVELAAFRDSVNAGVSYEGLTIKLTADIDLADIVSWNPIGVKDGNKFKGVFDGQNHIIKNMTITTGPDYAAFFGAVENAVLKDFSVEGEVTGANVAGIAGRVDGSSKLINITNKASVNGSNKAAGIAVKTEANDSLFDNCVNYGAVSCSTNNGAAGIVVYAQNGKFTIKNCTNEGSVTAPRAGGIIYNVSDNGNGIVESCVNNGKIGTFYGTNDKVAGIVSVNAVGTNLTIADCKNTGVISGQNASSITCAEYTHVDGKPNTNTGIIRAKEILYVSENSATINSDLTANVEIFVGSEVTIEGGNYTGNITNKGTLTVKNGTFTSVSNFFNEGTLLVNGGSFGTIRTNNAGKTVINNGTIAWLGTGATGSNTYTGSLVVNNGEIGGNISLAAGTGTIEIKGGHFTYDESTQVMINIHNEAQGTVTISGGNFEWSTQNRFCMANNDKLSITGGTFKY